MNKFNCIYCCRKILAKNYNKHLLTHKKTMSTFETALYEKVFIALGEASMCWDKTPKGIFDSTRAEQIGKDLVRFVLENCDKKSPKINK